MHIISSLNNSFGGCYWLLEVGQEVHGAGRAAAKALLDAVTNRKRRLEGGAAYQQSPSPVGRLIVLRGSGWVSDFAKSLSFLIDPSRLV